MEISLHLASVRLNWLVYESTWLDWLDKTYNHKVVILLFLFYLELIISFIITYFVYDISYI